MKSLKGKKQDFKDNTLVNREPINFSEYQGDNGHIFSL